VLSLYESLGVLDTKVNNVFSLFVPASCIRSRRQRSQHLPLPVRATSWRCGWCMAAQRSITPSLTSTSLLLSLEDKAWQRGRGRVRGGTAQSDGGLLLPTKFLRGGNILLQAGSGSWVKAGQGAPLPSAWQARPPQHATSSSTRCGPRILSPPTGVWPPTKPSAASSPPAARQTLSLRLFMRTFYECRDGRLRSWRCKYAMGGEVKARANEVS
jgi:hypothetical protein